MFDWNDLIKHEIIWKACSNAKCSSMQACNRFSWHSRRPKKNHFSKFSCWFFMEIHHADNWTSTATFWRSTSTCCEQLIEKQQLTSSELKAVIENKRGNSILITVRSICWSSVRRWEAKCGITLKLRQISILVLLPPLFHRAPTSNQCCFSSSSTTASIDSGKISNYQSRELRNTRERATVLPFLCQTTTAAASCCILLKKLWTVKTFRWWRSMRF